MMSRTPLIAPFLDPAFLMVLPAFVAILCLLIWKVGVGRRIAVGLALVSLAIIAVPTVFSIDDAVLSPLEERFPQIDPPEAIHGIIIVGGGISGHRSADRSSPALNASADRIVIGLGLGHRYPDVPIVYTGGSGLPHRQEQREADWIPMVASMAGIGADRLILERNSRTTVENAEMTAEIVDPAPDRPWLLVTSSFHMPRTAGVFLQNGFKIIPYPVDYRTRPGFTPEFGVALGSRLNGLAIGLHEWLGLIVYRLRGETPALFPSPKMVFDRLPDVTQYVVDQ